MPRKEEILGLNRLTKKRILELCKKDKLYQTPELNDVLYLHYQGFERIECLEDYTELKCLWLECNAISEIQGLDKLTKLKCLFLQSNLIRKIENLEFCKELDTINLSQNHIRKIENCGSEVLPVLNTLNISSNYLKDCESLMELEYCKNVSVLDLSNNRIDDILVVKVFAHMPELKVLVLQGNPVVSKIPQYRKTLILECKKLTYLDSRPVFPKDRACAEAWKRGGYEEERKENERWNRRERKKMRDGVNATIHLRNKNRKPDDQIPLITSSDSEDDTISFKENRNNCVESNASTDCIWDEVSQSKELQEHILSDISNDSNTNESYQNSQSSNNGNIFDSVLGENKESEIRKDLQTPDKEKELEFLGQETFDGEKTCSLIDSDLCNSHILNQSGQQYILKQEKHLEKFEEKIKIEERNISCVLDKNNPLSTVNLDPLIKNIETTPESFKKINLHIENYTDQEEDITSHSNVLDIDAQEQYVPITKAIKEITSENTLEHFNLKLDENLGIHEQVENNYEPLKELEETMNSLKKQETVENTSNQLQTKKNKEMLKLLSPRSKLKNEEESLKINSQLKTDFEDLSANLNAFVEQLDKEQEERQEVIKALFNNSISTKGSSCESSDKEESYRLIDQCDQEFKRKTTKVENQVTRLELTNQEQIKVFGTEEKDENLTISFEGLPINQLQICESDHFGKPSDTNENKSLSCVFANENFDNLPMNISLLTRQSNEALNSLERESKELKKLLQKLEDENGSFFNNINVEKNHQKDEENQDNEENAFAKEKLVKRNETQSILDVEKEKLLKHNKNYKNQSEADNMDIQPDKCYPNAIKRHENKQKKPKETYKEQIVFTILDELLKSLELKQTSYAFSKPINSSEEPNLSSIEMPSQQQQFSHSFPEFSVAINDFFNNIENKNQDTLKSILQLQKPAALNDLSTQLNLRQFNNDALEYLDEQLEEINRKRSKKVRRMVDRVYAKKDRYNDSLELVDGKLMVRNKDTNELGEFPPAVQEYSSASETDYDTAQSEDEDDNNSGFQCKKHLWEDKKNYISYKPSACKSSEDLVTKALIDNNRKITFEDSEEESDEEFYSLDTHDKPNLFSIDKELYHKLTLDNLNISEIDENHIVQCARSYTDLKHYLADSKEGRCSTNKESELLKHMIERKCKEPDESSKNLLQTLKCNSKLGENEQLWLNKLSLYSEETYNQETVEEETNTLDLKSSRENIQLFEYKIESISKNFNQNQQEEQSDEADDDVTMKQLLLKTLPEKREKFKNDKVLKDEQRKKNYKSLPITERQSEEKKNEFESNMNFTSGAVNKEKKINANNSVKTSKQFMASSTIVSKQVVSGSDVDILECNLEIIGCNDELVDTITVNAELHF